MNIKVKIFNFMSENAYKPMDASELARIFDIKTGDMSEFENVLDSMEKDGAIIKNRAGRFGMPEKMSIFTGMLECNSKGFGFVICDDLDEDIFIPGSNMNGALNGDKVAAKITREKEKGKRYEGEISRIIERTNKTVIGVYENSKNFGFVVPEDKRIFQDIFISKSQKKNAKTGDIVIAEITQWPDKRRNPEGKVVEILGKKGDTGIDILTIIKKYDIRDEFPGKVMNYVENIDTKIPEAEIKRRKDYRNLKIVTIDGEDAKDLDDAVSVQRLENGNIQLGVHIADVSYYVKDKNPLDKEALLRGNSVYLLDRVLPMLPRKLSNNLCSLNPHEDKLTLSCVMEIDNTGKVVNYDINESIIATSERMTYTNVTKILKGEDEEVLKRYEYLIPDFKLMEELCSILHKKRIDRGAIDFDFDECKITLDENGKPIDIRPYEREIANRVIEEFMLVCNETVAEHMFWANIPFVYRIHEDPDEEKLMHFNEFVHNLGYFIKNIKEVHPKALQEIIDKVKGSEEETVISTLLLRSLKQAKYSPQCLGHFGLADKYYCHFTSPIRRYPDLMIHRIIKEFINGEINEKRAAKLQADVEFASTQSSQTERVADDAEREVDDLKKAEYMKERVGEVYDGLISSVTNFGIFVELPNTIEGLVHISSLDDDYYKYDERHLQLIGERTRKIYKLGDKISIEVSKVDVDAREIFFELHNENNEEENNVLD